ncbi:MAG: CRTAC1 family protein [Phycisphaerales bacterium]
MSAMTIGTACACVALSFGASPIGASADGSSAGGSSAAGSSARASTATGASPATAAARPIHFTDVTEQSGLHAVMTSGKLPSTQILEVKGGGLALVDFDNDGDLDVFMPNGATLDDPEHGPGARVFENLGGMRFRDVTATSGLSLTRWAFGVAAGDIDGDGRDDLYVCCFGPDVLLRNVTEPGGPIRFEDVTASSGIKDDAWSTGAAFGDLDGDGDLDLFVSTYLDFDPRHPPGPTIFNSIPVMAGPVGLPPAADILYENIGGGRFRDVSEASGIRGAKPSYGLNVAILDLTGDGRPDIYVGNDSKPKNLFRNIGEPHHAGATTSEAATTALRFEDIGMKSGVATNIEGTEQATMGIAIADVDGNGFPDIFTTNFSSDTNTLMLNRDGRTFDDRTQQYGLGAVSRPYLGWACGFFDFDLDGDEDLLIFNGHVYPQATKRTMDSDYEQTPLLFDRRGKRFERVLPATAGAWLGEPHRDRTAVFGDLDGDGDIDVIVGELCGPLRVLRNDAIGAATGQARSTDAPNKSADSPAPSEAATRAWLIVELRDTKAPGNRHAVGAVVTCRSADSTQRRFIYGGGPFQSTIVPVAHFGIPAGAAGAATSSGAAPSASTVPSQVAVEVRWPDGEVTTKTLDTGRRHVIER